MKTYVVVLNWNGKDFIEECLDSLSKQSHESEIVVVDNGSTDGSVELIERKYPKIHLIKELKNHGFAGGVNIGIKYAIKEKANAVALFNNDAVADKNWLKELVKTLEKNDSLGAVTGKLLSRDGKRIDSTGDLYSIWGLTIAGQRNMPTEKAIREAKKIFGASAGACLYRSSAIKEIRFFDEKFFAYYEDTDVSFRLQLSGWEVMYCPSSIAYHATGSTSSKLKGFTTYQTIKNLPILFFKDVPLGLMPKMLPRFFLAYYLILVNSLLSKRAWFAIKGHVAWLINIPHTLIHRRRIQKNRKVSNVYINSMLFQDLPKDAHRLRRFRSFFTHKS